MGHMFGRNIPGEMAVVSRSGADYYKLVAGNRIRDIKKEKMCDHRMIVIGLLCVHRYIVHQI